jgi:arabinan endo-1,5-alpha-L-arabinosidase
MLNNQIRLNVISFLCIAGVLLSGCGGSGGGGSSTPPPPPPLPPPVSDSTYLWDLSGNLGTHDPTIMEQSGIWYEFQTGPGIYRKYSNDSLAWIPLPSLLPAKLPWWVNYVPNQAGTDVWAPDVHEYNGRVWLYYSISTFGSRTSAIGLLSADSLAVDDTGWEDEGLVISTNETDGLDYNAIDPNLTIDEFGDPWLTFGSWNDGGIQLTQLDNDDMSTGYMKPTGPLTSIAARPGGIEAPVIIHRNNYYYLFVSVGLCCRGVNSTYRIFYGRADTITGPYLDKDGVDMVNGGGSLLEDGDERWIGPGGQDIHDFNGTDVIAFHAYDAADAGNAKLLMATLIWDAEDWPIYDE